MNYSSERDIKCIGFCLCAGSTVCTSYHHIKKTFKHDNASAQSTPNWIDKVD